MSRLPAVGGTPGIHLCRGALRSGLQSKSMGAGTPAPQLRLLPAKFGAGKF